MLPTKKKLSTCISDYTNLLSFTLGRFLSNLADDQCSISKGNIYYIKHNVHTAVYHGSGFTRDRMFNQNICYVSFCTYGRVNDMWNYQSKKSITAQSDRRSCCQWRFIATNCNYLPIVKSSASSHSDVKCFLEKFSLFCKIWYICFK